MSDRTVHAVTADGREVVRYDRAGKWYIEGDVERVRVSLKTAVAHATQPGASASLRLPGGQAFDAGVRRAQAA